MSTTAPEQVELISEACREAFRQQVADLQGVEVFAIGTVGPSGAVEELDPIAFGNWDSVPAPAQNARPGQVLIHNHPSGGLEPSDADIDVASLYGKAGIGFYIVDNDCANVRVVVKPFREEKIEPLDVASLAEHLKPSGALAHGISDYEFRPQQVEMLELSARAFNGDRIVMVEAGTGTGKSFAYLIPAILWAVQNKQRVVVATNTINLQEQLMAKDIPELRGRLGVNFRAALLKGRSNYISLRRLKYAARSADLFPDVKSRELVQLQDWAGKTLDGSRSDIHFEVSDAAWEAAVSDKDDCQRARCPHFNDCFLYKSRREAAAADIVVANHHLLMSDVALRVNFGDNDYLAILPPFQRLIVDEAHHLEAVATDHFSTETSLYAMRRQLAKLMSPRDRRGGLTRLEREVFSADAGAKLKPTARILELLSSDIPDLRVKLDGVLDQLFDDLFDSTLRHFNIDKLGRTERRELRVTRTVAESAWWEEASGKLNEIAAALGELLKPIEKVLSLMRGYPEEKQNELADARLNVNSAAAKLADHANSIKYFLKAGEDHCRWFEVGYFRDRPTIRPCVAPLSVAPQLRKALFEKKPTIILTSATLTVEKSFDFFARQLGLVMEGDAAPQAAAGGDGNLLREIAARTDFLQLGSPFDYQRNCIIGITTDTPAPTTPGFEQSIESAVLDAVRITGGRAFVLFTSYKSLQKTHAGLAEPLARVGITALRQGEMPRHRLLESFRGHERAALFATSSFWEGVDVKGSALECLIITKLPFHVPTTPILEARAERIDLLGGDSFREMSLPLAVVRFKQGFGRLIRSKTDRGIVLVLDHRIVTKYYGKIFLRSLPSMTVVQDGASKVLVALRRFYDRDAPNEKKRV
ncbi:MAG: DEAD/DEAH box helicase family protein [Candidatus Sumerlaeaceae bacterium]|nr:DEAD/DEAH box helicase family protein [Candidatus Sumerlaeaceae bacterium]